MVSDNKWYPLQQVQLHCAGEKMEKEHTNEKKSIKKRKKKKKNESKEINPFPS